MISFPLGNKDQFVLYEEKESFHYLLLNIPPDNRFTPQTIPAIIEAITYIRHECDPKPLVTSSTSAKFYSNGLDFEQALACKDFFSKYYYPMLRAFIEFPWPTIALVNGHAFAAGFMLVECHDYSVMNANRGWLCMNEVEFGAPLMAGLMSVFRPRFGIQLTHKITLTAHRFDAKEAFANQLITKIGGMPEVLEIVADVKKFAVSPSYAQIRKELFRELLTDLKNYDESVERDAVNSKFEDEFYQNIIKKYRSRM